MWLGRTCPGKAVLAGSGGAGSRQGVAGSGRLVSLRLGVAWQDMARPSGRGMARRGLSRRGRQGSSWSGWVSHVAVRHVPAVLARFGMSRPGAAGQGQAVASRSGPASRVAVRPSRHGLSRRDEAGLGRPGEVGQGLPRQGQAVPARPAMVWLGWAGRGL